MQKASVGNRVKKIARWTKPELKLLADIDGTIAGESNQISQPVNKRFCGLPKGVQVAIATGRMYRSAFYASVQKSTLAITTYQGAWLRSSTTTSPLACLSAKQHINCWITSSNQNKIAAFVVYFYQRSTICPWNHPKRKYTQNVLALKRSQLVICLTTEPTKF